MTLLRNKRIGDRSPNERYLKSVKMDKKWLDRIIEDGMVRCYSESDVLNRTLVGHGGFGIVYKAKLKHTGMAVAMKMLSLGAYTDEQELYKKFVKEVCVVARYAELVSEIVLIFVYVS